MKHLKRTAGVVMLVIIAGCEGDKSDKLHETVDHVVVFEQLHILSQALQSKVPNADEAAASVIKKLFIEARKDPVKLSQGILLFQAQGGVDTYPATLTAFRCAVIDDRSIIAAIVPFLRDPDPHVRTVSQRLLSVVEKRMESDGLDFSSYSEYLRHEATSGGEAIPEIVFRMFFLDPSQALSVMLNINIKTGDQQKPIRWSAKMVDDALWKRQYGFAKPSEVDPAAVQALTDLANRPEWYARLYVVYISKMHPELCPKDVMERLRNDVHPLVKDAVNSQVPPP